MDKSNPIVAFLEGEWQCETVRVCDGEISKNSYEETMRKKLMSIHLKKTAYGIMNGKDLTKPMERSLEDGTVTLVQDAFVATGTFKGNVVNLSGKT